MGQKAPAETARLTGREPEDSISSSESLSEEVGDNSGVVVGEKFQKKAGANVFFFSMADNVRRGPGNRRFLTGLPLIAGRDSSLDRREEGVIEVEEVTGSWEMIREGMVERCM